jgi:hypothetical protein
MFYPECSRYAKEGQLRCEQSSRRLELGRWRRNGSVKYFSVGHQEQTYVWKLLRMNSLRNRAGNRIRTGDLLITRRIAAAIGRISGDASRFDGVGEEARRYRARVDAVRLDRFTPEALSRWREDYIGAAGDDERSRAKRRIAAASLLRQAGALFSGRMRSVLGGLQSLCRSGKIAPSQPTLPLRDRFRGALL